MFCGRDDGEVLRITQRNKTGSCPQGVCVSVGTMRLKHTAEAGFCVLIVPMIA